MNSQMDTTIKGYPNPKKLNRRLNKNEVNSEKVYIK